MHTQNSNFKYRWLRGDTYEERDAILDSLGFGSYKAYKQTALWQSIKARAFQKTSGHCTRCGHRATQIHHANYSMAVLMGKELGALHPICYACHQAIERWPWGAKRTLKEANKALFGKAYSTSFYH